jgi:hypothetical protein
LKQKETVAVFWESKVRTYGFDLQEGLFLWRLKIMQQKLPYLGTQLSGSSSLESRFEWVVAHTGDAPTICLWLLCDEKNSPLLSRILEDHPTLVEPLPEASPLRVDVLNFQGPHFGDRYGIADYTMTALATGGVPLIGMMCSVSGISLVLPYGKGAKSKEALLNAFEIPKEKDPTSRYHIKNLVRTYE